MDGFEDGTDGWRFSNGPEYGGASGGVLWNKGSSHSGNCSLRLCADFSSGGKYTAAQFSPDFRLVPGTISLWVRPLGVSYVLIRLIDSSGQTFQHKKKLEDNGNWQKVVLENPASPTRWGGKNDGQWHGKLTGISVLIEKQSLDAGKSEASVDIDNVCVAEKTAAADMFTHGVVVPLGDFDGSLCGWWPYNDVDVRVNWLQDAADGDSSSGCLLAELKFPEYGGWVSLIRQLDQPFFVSDMSFSVKTDNVSGFLLSILSSEGQRYEKKIRIDKDGEWQKVNLSDIPFGNGIQDKNAKLFGAKVCFRISVTDDDLRNDSIRRASVRLDDASCIVAGNGVLYVPGSSIRAAKKVWARFDICKSPPIFWGEHERPGFIDLTYSNGSDVPIRVDKIELQDHALRTVAIIHEGGEKIDPGKKLEKRISFDLKKFGHYTIKTYVAGEPLTCRLAWIREEGKPDAGSRFGVQLHLAQGPWGRSQYVGGGAGLISLVRKLGAGWIREDIKGFFDNKDNLIGVNNTGFFGWDDSLLTENIGIIGNYVDYLGAQRAPSSPDARMRYSLRLRQLSKALAGKVNVFEIWNEPNISPGWRGKPNSEDYSKLLEDAFSSVKEVSPDSVILGIASCGTDFDYIRQVAASSDGRAPNMDAISVHPYHGVAPERGNPSANPPPVWMGTGGNLDFRSRMYAVKKIMSDAGFPDMDVWATELGFGGKNPEEEWRDTCRLIRQYMIGLSIPFLDVMVTYNMQDQGYDEEESSHMTFGLLKSDGSPEPRFVSYNTMCRALNGFCFSYAETLAGNVNAYVFTNKVQKTVMSVWTEGHAGTISLHTGDKEVRKIDLMGNISNVKPIAGLVTFAVSGEPFFLEIDSPFEFSETHLLSASALRKEGTGGSVFPVSVFSASEMQGFTISGVAGPGWNAVSVPEHRILFTANDSLKSGQYVLEAHIGDMSAAVSVNVDNSIPIKTSTRGDGSIAIDISNPFPFDREIDLGIRDWLSPTYGISPGKVKIPAFGSVTTNIVLKTRIDKFLVTTGKLSLNPVILDGKPGYLQYDGDDAAVSGALYWNNADRNFASYFFSEQNVIKRCFLGKEYQFVPIGKFSDNRWGGTSDLSGEFAVGSDSSNIYVAVCVKDDKHVQNFSSDEMWKGDSVQFAMVFDGIDYEFTAAVFPDGSAQVRRDRPPAANLNKSEQMPIACGSINDGEYTMRMRIPWEAVGQKPGSAPPSSFALIINDNDGQKPSVQDGRKGYLEWFGGIGGTDGKRPEKYGPVLIAEP